MMSRGRRIARVGGLLFLSMALGLLFPLRESRWPKNPDPFGSMFHLAILHYAEGHHAQAKRDFEHSRALLFDNLDIRFSDMSENDRLLYLDKLNEFFSAYYSFCFTYREPALVGEMYDLVLRRKGLVASSMAALWLRSAASRDRKVRELREKLLEKREEVSQLLEAPPEDREKVEREVDWLEEKLAEDVPSLREHKWLAKPVTWKEVRKKLKKHQAAIEFIHFPFHDGKRLTDTHYYVALILTAKSKHGPVLVPLGDEKTLEGAPISDYLERIGVKMSTGENSKPDFYEAFWKPLEDAEPALASAQTIYLSPDGILNLVSFGVILDHSSPPLPLLEKYDLRIVSSTKDLLRGDRMPSKKIAVLIGNPQFSLDDSAYRAAAPPGNEAAGPNTPRTPAISRLRPSGLQGDELKPLEGTKTELETVERLLRSKGWHVDLYSEARAQKDAILRVRGPRILLVATHGFFVPDQESNNELATRLSSDQFPGLEDPMLRSGLFFSGANRVRKGLPVPAGMDDGVLTAYEAADLNLQGTELVVLSACGTGLGQTKSGEGVFGLRRALQMAGAEAVIMSMWSVPDKETVELMELFYGSWLGGKDKHEALRAAQRTMRERVRDKNSGADYPNKWGAFVLVGR